jgi:long-chain acyl-CoA synthetase
MSVPTVPPTSVTDDEFHPADVAARLDRLVSDRTLPAEFLDTVRSRLDRVALRWKEGTAWQELTWSQYRDRVARLAGGLGGLGVGPGDRVLLLLPNRPEFHIVDMAIMFLGATPVSIYITSSAEQIDHLVRDTGAVVAVVHDRAMLERFRGSTVARDAGVAIVVVDPTDVDGGRFHTLAELEAREPIDLDERLPELDPQSAATIIYTSGTTGPSKGVELSHFNVLWAVQSLKVALGDVDLTGKRIVSYLPMAHIAERSTTHYSAAVSGYEVTTCDDPARLAEHLREVRPHLVFGVPRVWEKMRAGVESVLQGDAEKWAQFTDAVLAAGTLRRAVLDGTATDTDRETLDFLDAVAFAPIRAAMGLDEIEIAVTGAAPIPPETVDWFRAVGVPLSEIYGMSESSGPISWSPFGAEAGSVGAVIPGAELRLAEDSEVLFRGGNVFVGYLGRPDATAETIDSDGWLHTGDIGVLDDRSHLRIVDRKKELLVTAGGKNVSPANLEAAIRSLPLVAHAIAVGDGRPWIGALITLDHESLVLWAANRQLGIDEPALLCRHPEVVAEVERGVDEVMARFSRAERVKRILILPDEWAQDSAFLTPTLKLRRRPILAHYATQIEELYSTTETDRSDA